MSNNKNTSLVKVKISKILNLEIHFHWTTMICSIRKSREDLSKATLCPRNYVYILLNGLQSIA